MAFDDRKLKGTPPVELNDPLLRPNLPKVPHSRPGARPVPGFGGKAEHEKVAASRGMSRRGYDEPID
jgi:hypothetical protein